MFLYDICQAFLCLFNKVSIPLGNVHSIIFPNICTSDFFLNFDQKNRRLSNAQELLNAVNDDPDIYVYILVYTLAHL